MAKRSVLAKERRQAFRQPIAERIYIFCEGEKTEPLYFEGFRKLIDANPIYYRKVLLEIRGEKSTTLALFKKARQYVEAHHLQHGQIWCVYDKDDFPANDFNAVAELIERENEALRKQGLDLSYRAAWSNECIEFWFILHFDFYTANNRRTAYLKYLNERLGRLCKRPYEKNLVDLFDLLLKYGDPRRAIAYAKKINEEADGKRPADIAPGTKVYELVEILAKYLPEEVRARFLG